MSVGPEAEFFLFKRGDEPADDRPARRRRRTSTSRRPTSPRTRGAHRGRARAMGFEVEASHHEVAHGQHEIDFRHADALTRADNIVTFRCVVKHVAQQNGLTRRSCRSRCTARTARACTSTSRFRAAAERVLRPERRAGASATACDYIAGLLEHAAGVRDLQPDGQLVQAAVPGLRGAGLHRLVNAATARPRSGSPPGAAARRAPSCARPIPPRTRTSRSPCLLRPGSTASRGPAPAGPGRRQHLPPHGRGVGRPRHQGPAAQPRGRAHGARGGHGAADGAR